MINCSFFTTLLSFASRFVAFLPLLRACIFYFTRGFFHYLCCRRSLLTACFAFNNGIKSHPARIRRYGTVRYANSSGHQDCHYSFSHITIHISILCQVVVPDSFYSFSANVIIRLRFVQLLCQSAVVSCPSNR